MADNVTLDAGSGGDSIAADEISSVKYQRVKITLGADGTNDGDVSSANPIPITNAALTELAAAIDTQVQVDVVESALPTGAATAAKQPSLGTAGTASADVITVQGVTSMTPLQVGDNSGSLTVDNGGTFAVQVDGTALTRLTDIETNTDSNAVVGNGAAATAQRVTLANDSTGVIATVGAVTSVTNPVAVTQSGTWDEVGINDSGNSITVDAPVGTPVFVRLSDGSSAIATLPVSLASVPSHAVTNAGTFAVQESGGALTALQIMDDWDNAASDGASVSGDVAHDSADAGEPIKVGAKATTALSGLTLVADADRTNLFAGVDGVQIIRQDCNLEDIVTATPVAITDGSSTSVISAQGSGVKFYLTEITIANSSSSNVTVDLRDGTAGSVKWTFPVPANGGVVKTFKVPLPFSANTAMAADPSAAASTITVSALGFKSKV
jgi:hypothetical protein